MFYVCVSKHEYEWMWRAQNKIFLFYAICWLFEEHLFPFCTFSWYLLPSQLVCVHWNGNEIGYYYAIFLVVEEQTKGRNWKIAWNAFFSLIFVCVLFLPLMKKEKIFFSYKWALWERSESGLVFSLWSLHKTSKSTVLSLYICCKPNI